MLQRSIRTSGTVAVIVFLIAAVAAFGPACSKDKSGAEGQSGGASNVATGAAGKGAVVVKVNGKAITESEVATEAQRLASAMGGQGDPQQMPAIRRQAVEVTINRMLLEQAIASENVKVPKEQVVARMEEMKKSFPSEQAFNERLAAMGVSLQEFDREIEVGLGFEALFAKHGGNPPPPSEAEMRSFYDSNVQSFKQPERVTASHILVAVGQGDTDAQKAEKRAKAAKIRSELVGGADFAQEATQYSDCPSKQQGGNLGTFSRDKMVPEFANAAFALKVGDLSDVVETQFGYHIIKVTAHEQSRDIPFEESKADIAAYLVDQGKQAAINSYIQTLRNGAKIEYADTTGMGQ